MLTATTSFLYQGTVLWKVDRLIQPQDFENLEDFGKLIPAYNDNEPTRLFLSPQALDKYVELISSPEGEDYESNP